MRKFKFLVSACAVALVFTATMNSCKDSSDDPTPLTVTSMKAGSIDLNGVTAPSNVAANAVIKVTFATEVDKTTAIAANISLKQDYDKSVVPVTISFSGDTMVITPTGKLGNGSLYTLSFSAGLKATNGLTLSALSRAFTTEGSFIPSGRYAYWNFDGNANDQVGSHNPLSAGVVDIIYADGRKASAGKAASFNGSTSIIEIPKGDELLNTSDFALSFWVKPVSANKTTGHFVMGLAGWNGLQFEIGGDYKWCKLAAQYAFQDGTSGSEDLWFNGEGKTKDNGGWQGWTFCKDLTSSGTLSAIIQDKWVHVVCLYNSTTKVGTMYLNGEKVKAQDFNLWPAGDKKLTVNGLKYNGAALDKVFAFGFIQGGCANRSIADDWANPAVATNNHFQGLLDDVAIYHRVLTETEIGLMYNSGKP